MHSNSHCGSPLRQQRSKWKNANSIRKQSFADVALSGLPGIQAACPLNSTSKGPTDKDITCSGEISSGINCGGYSLSALRPSSSSSLSSSISDLFTFEDVDSVESVDDRVRPRFRFLSDLY
ncbi:hypothetical protein KP509_27G068300 [Ceratopteris richardii]|uniref:Uncharacterized protein n=1 Tax=Ceratopteris richardii TaxID=49495 RepID=A0A8T2RHH7_CERRI|nr:hypothetical protein KP509_27G068300 [Ceratopteris richardii]